MNRILISIVVPAFNEERTIGILIEELLRQNYGNNVDSEIIIVDDCSKDKTTEIASRYINKNFKIVRMERNSGKGAAVRKGVELSHGDFVLVQDADLEYFPSDIPSLIEKALQSPGASIYGSRVLGAKTLGGLRGKISLWPGQSIASLIFNYVLSLTFFLLYKKWITDSLTGYKLYPSDLFRNWTQTTTGFETDHEITSMILKNKRDIYEIPIKYKPRTKKDGKKIRGSDAFIALRTIWRLRK